ncbi:ATPase, AAA-type, core [Parasponia andersonii]|uniref:Chromosome transmission fidelity protein 18 homolog n=1 Tax=Parasponia andersonii TaxID=3476 RepID=A0A2P5CS03_PARAD|nr:ATPase, AAA-type, core [Parasponia andersonii]
MDMDIDLPLPEELELLEESYHFNEDDLDLEPAEPYPYPYEEEEKEEEEQPTLAKSPAPSSSEAQINGHKRSRSSDGPDSSVAQVSRPSDEKRCRVDEEEEEEDWLLRYSLSEEAEPIVEEGVGEVLEEKLVWRFASEIDGDFIPVTAPSGGDRVYAKVVKEERKERREKLDMKTPSGGLIVEPINVLLQKVEQEAFTKALQASSGGQSDQVFSETPIVHEQLWVDKYAPNSFTELLSDEQTNREVLLWLKQWDSCVFGSEVRSTSSEVLSALRRHSTIGQHQKFSGSNFRRNNRGPRWNKENLKELNDFDHKNSNSNSIQDLWNKKSRCTGPPEQKILLLCGPPGLGKTTLAHVAARHCGYRVVEINASDDRSSSTIEAKILDVVQMNSVTVDARPKCLVIDEIDGALGDGKGAMEVILKMVSADRKSDVGKENVANEDNPQKISTKKGRKSEPLSRPVICICNDLYAPVLRPLRQVAKVHVFVQPTVSRVVSRLKYICNKEGMKTSSIGLTALADYTECDIRSCLNTLQFLHKKKEALNVLEVSSQVVGQKDMSKSVFDIWKEVFQKRKFKRVRRSNMSGESTSNEFDSLHSLISSRGDYDLIMDGMHENILQLHYHDPVMQKTVKCLNTLGVSDLLHQYIMRSQHMPLYAFQPAIAITIHRLVAQVQKPNIVWPKSYQRYRTMLMEKRDILRSWYNMIPPHISRHFSITSFVEESVSPLLHILSPSTLRPVALNLISEKEKNDLDQLVSKMVSYAITYKNVKSNPLPGGLVNEATSDQLALAFDPPIAGFINFKGYRSGHYVLALSMKQMLVHEVEKQRILQVSAGRFANITDGGNKENPVLPGEEFSRSQPQKAAKSIENTLRHSNPSITASSCISDSNRSATTASAKLKTAKDTKRSSSSFFDR